MYQNRNCYSEVKARQSSPLNPYPLLSPPNAPQLPVFDHQAWYMRRDQLMPPTIGFKLEILDGPTTTTPYPEMNNTGMGASDSSMEMPSSYKSDDTVSDIDDIDSSVSCENPSVPTAKFSADSEGRDLCTQDVIKVGEARPQPPLKGERVHLTRRGLPYPAEAYAKTSHLPCDHSGGDHGTHSLSHAD